MDAVKSAITSQPAHWPKTVSLCTMCRTHTYHKLMIGGRRNKRHRKNKKMRSKYQYSKYGPTDFLFSQIKYAPIISVIIKLSGPLLSDWESTYHMLCGVQYYWCTLVAFFIFCQFHLLSLILNLSLNHPNLATSNIDKTVWPEVYWQCFKNSAFHWFPSCCPYSNFNHKYSFSFLAVCP